MDFGPKSNVIKTSLGFQFPTKLIKWMQQYNATWVLQIESIYT